MAHGIPPELVVQYPSAKHIPFLPGIRFLMNLQDVAAKNGDEAETLSRNCQLPQGQRAFLQTKRQVDAVPPEVREKFKKMQRE